MADDEVWFVIVNCPSTEVAEAIGKGALVKGLAKAFNITGEMRTSYLWQGEVVENREVQLIFKLAGEDREALFAFAKSQHPFDVPSIKAWPIAEVDPDYRRYILGE